jgi:hypothetical protein
MRSLLLVVLLAVGGGVFAASGAARSSARGDGCFVVSQGYGKVMVTLTRGVLFGRYSEGQLTYNDRGGDVHLPTVPNVTPTHPTDHTWVYSNANDVRFRTIAPTKLTINAQLINLSVAGKGSAWLSVAGFSPSFAGKFSVDSNSFCEGNFQRMPVVPTKFSIASPVAG